MREEEAAMGLALLAGESSDRTSLLEEPPQAVDRQGLLPQPDVCKLAAPGLGVAPHFVSLGCDLIGALLTILCLLRAIALQDAGRRRRSTRRQLSTDDLPVLHEQTDKLPQAVSDLAATFGAGSGAPLSSVSKLVLSS